MRVLHLDPSLDDPAEVVRNLRFRPDGRALAALVGSQVFWWDLGRDAPGRPPLWADDDEPREARPDPAVSPDLEVVARDTFDTDTGAAAVRVTDTWAHPADDRTLVWGPGDGTEFTALAFTPDGAGLLAAAKSDPAAGAAVLRWDVGEVFDADPYDPPDPEASDPGSAGVPTCLAGSPGGRLVVAGTHSGHLWARSQQTGRQWAAPTGRRRAVEGVAFSPDGALVVVRQRGAVTVWDADRWAAVGGVPGDRPTDAGFSPDGRTLAVASADGAVAFHDARTLAEVARWAWPVGGLHSVAFAPDGLLCAAGGDRGRVVLWDIDG